MLSITEFPSRVSVTQAPGNKTVMLVPRRYRMPTMFTSGMITKVNDAGHKCALSHGFARPVGYRNAPLAGCAPRARRIPSARRGSPWRGRRGCAHGTRWPHSGPRFAWPPPTALRAGGRAETKWGESLRGPAAFSAPRGPPAKPPGDSAQCPAPERYQKRRGRRGRADKTLSALRSLGRRRSARDAGRQRQALAVLRLRWFGTHQPCCGCGDRRRPET